MAWGRDPEDEIEILKDEIRDLKREISWLESENNRLALDLDSAEVKIKTELDPRLKREAASYDSWVTDPERHINEAEQ